MKRLFLIVALLSAILTSPDGLLIPHAHAQGTQAQGNPAVKVWVNTAVTPADPPLTGSSVKEATVWAKRLSLPSRRFPNSHLELIASAQSYAVRLRNSAIERFSPVARSLLLPTMDSTESLT
jgi:hypothetical protein